MKKLFASFVPVLGAALMVLSSCTGASKLTQSGLDSTRFDTTINEKPVRLYVLKNQSGMEVCVTNFGGRIVSINVPDKDGKSTDVVLGYDNIAQYADTVNNSSDFGAAIGRYANRIKDGKIVVAGKTIQLPRNNYGHCLHGGFSGWQYQVYEGTQENDSTLKLVMHSPDGDNQFPGNVTATVTYTVKSDNTLDIQYEATTDAETVINMTNHSYFNLSGDPSKSAMDELLYINADSYTPVDNTFMTSGEIANVKGTPMDFTTPHAISDHIGDTTFVQIANANGYDHNWVLNTFKDGKGDFSQVAASLYAPSTGILLEVFTDQPGIQVYTGNFLDGTRVGKRGITYPQRASVCLETQVYPDSPNKWIAKTKGWYNPYLKPGETYKHHTAFKFSVKK